MQLGQIERQRPGHRGDQIHVFVAGKYALHERDVREIVLDIEDLHSLARLLSGHPDRGIAVDGVEPRQWTFRTRQFDPEAAALPRGRLDTKCAAHRFGESLGKRETEPGSLDALLEP